MIDAIETCPKPVVAAVDWAELGGGLELALACDARLATPAAVLGLPEVTLGIIPGSGGTQRLPRVVDIARAIQLIRSGERISAQRALQLCLIDAIVEGDRRKSAVAHAIGLRGRKHRLRDRAVPAEDASTVASGG